MNSLRESSLFQLTVTRFRLFLREPEAVFWIFVFPILLAIGLGIAFRNRCIARMLIHIALRLVERDRR